jgi:hypothetical protein
MRFLAAVQFSNGFDTMKWLNIGNRIKWMKICTLLWHQKDRKINNFRFDIDDQKTGLDLDRRLQALDELQLNRFLAQIDGGASLESLPYISITNQYASALGFTFYSQEDEGGILSIIF